MTRLLSLLLSLALVASLAIPGGAVSHCETASAAIGCCPAPAQPVQESCCCLEQPAPTPAALPSVDRHWLVEDTNHLLVASIATLWSYAPADVPAGIWRASPLLAFAGAPPPRERFCIILT